MFWSCDFVARCTSDGRVVWMLVLIVEHTRKHLAIGVLQSLNREVVLERLSDLFVRRSLPAYRRSDNGRGFTVVTVRQWLARVGVKTLFIGQRPGDGYVEGINCKLPDELFAPDQGTRCWKRRPHGAVAAALQHR
jgi:transposase InsO family protein